MEQLFQEEDGFSSSLKQRDSEVHQSSHFPVTKKQSETIKRNKEHCLVKEPVESPSSLERRTIYLFTSYLEQKRKGRVQNVLMTFAQKMKEINLYCSVQLAYSRGGSGFMKGMHIWTTRIQSDSSIISISLLLLCDRQLATTVKCFILTGCFTRNQHECLSLMHLNL